MKARLLRIGIAISAILSAALAGGASVKGF